MARSIRSTTNTLVALLRAVNVGGTGKLAMRDLAALCTRAGLADVQTYIQTGNVVFRTILSTDDAQEKLEKALARHMGAPVDVMVRTAAEMRAVVDDNPFPGVMGSHLYVFFCAKAVDPAPFTALRGPNDERAVPRGREVYIHYPIGMGASQLKLPKFPVPVTARNMNTVTKLAEMCGDRSALRQT